MKDDEWLTAYLLLFGPGQLFAGEYAEGETEFLDNCAASLGIKPGINHCNIVPHLRAHAQLRGYSGSNDS